MKSRVYTIQSLIRKKITNKWKIVPNGMTNGTIFFARFMR